MELEAGKMTRLNNGTTCMHVPYKHEIRIPTFQIYIQFRLEICQITHVTIFFLFVYRIGHLKPII